MNKHIEKIQFLESNVKMPLMNLPVRSVVVDTSTGKILLSPGSRLTDSDYQNIKNVTDIVATNLFHCAGVPKALEHFPNAKVWGPIGAKKLKPNIKWTHELGTDTWPHEEELKLLILRGMPKVNESVFYHAKSKSIYVSDLFFNMIDTKGFGAFLVQKMFGTYKKFAMSRFFSKFVSDRAIFESSLNAVLACDFENIIVSHGSNILGDGKTQFRKSIAERGFIN